MSRKGISKKIYFFVGTTTELIKLAPILCELERRNIQYKVITSGQTKVNFSELSFLIAKKNADIQINEKTDKSSLLVFAIWFFKTLFKIPTLKKEFRNLNKKNSFFIVHGDPVSSFLGALMAKYYNLKLVHVESGLRSFSFAEPFPEEICRVMISKLADIHFCPNQWSVNNLAKTSGVKINTFQNTQIESYLSAIHKNKVNKNLLKVPAKKYFIMIMHRQEHIIFGREKSKKLIKFVFSHIKNGFECIFITHATTLNFLKVTNLMLTKSQKKNVKFVSRLSYLDFIDLMAKSEFIITDGGSNQEEAFYMGLPCLILRSRSERVEGLGENALLCDGEKNIIKSFMSNYKKYKRKKVILEKSPSKIIVDYLTNH